METILRENRREDIPALTGLWSRVFGDPESLAEEFLRLLPALGGGCVAEADGRIVGAAYIVTALQVGEKRAAYLYAVAVEPAFRGQGLGGALSRAAAALGRRLGADFICTLPAENSLYGWYEALLGTVCALRRSEECFPVRPGPAVRALAAAEYNRRRELLLAGVEHLRLSDEAMAFEKFSCRCAGGDLFAVGDGLAAVYRDGRTAIVRELLCPDAAERRSLAAAAAAFCGAERTLLYSPAAEGLPYLAAEPGFVSPDCVWNLALD